MPLPLTSLAVLIPQDANAHAEVITPYDLPVPLWLYLFACAATLVLTFAAAGYFISSPDSGALSSKAVPILNENARRMTAEWILGFLRIGAVTILALTITAGFVGVSQPLSNISITLFWIIFVLGSSYSIALVGDFFQVINPWQTMVTTIEALGWDLTKARISYSQNVAYYPALIFYVALTWTELFVLQRPSTLSSILLAYTFVCLAGSWLLGKKVWFEYAEFFSVFFRLIGALAPVAYVRSPDSLRWRAYIRRPFAGLLQAPSPHMSLVLIVLFMLSSTTYDAMHNTDYWRNLYGGMP